MDIQLYTLHLSSRKTGKEWRQGERDIRVGVTNLDGRWVDGFSFRSSTRSEE